MRDEKITVGKAIQQYYMRVLLPFFGVMLGCFILGIIVIKDQPAISLMFIFGGILLASLVGATTHTHWIVWAFHHVDKPNTLYRRMLRTNMLKPKEHFYNKLNVTLFVDKAQYEQAWQLMLQEENLDDLAKSLPLKKVIEVRYTANPLVFSTVMVLFMGGLLAFLLTSGSLASPKAKMLLIMGPIFIGLWGYEAFKYYRNYGKVALLFSPEQLTINGKPMKWENILSAEVYREGKNTMKLSVTAVVGEVVDGQGKLTSESIELSGMDATPDHIDDLIRVYRQLSRQ